MNEKKKAFAEIKNLSNRFRFLKVTGGGGGGAKFSQNGDTLAIHIVFKTKFKLLRGYFYHQSNCEKCFNEC